jgi:hypothetical protein
MVFEAKFPSIIISHWAMRVIFAQLRYFTEILSEANVSSILVEGLKKNYIYLLCNYYNTIILSHLA